MGKSSFGYSDPVARLLTIGDPREIHSKADWRGGLDWPDYPAEYGLTEKDVPELIRMATDDELNQAWSDTKEVWAPIHAWRALGQMKVVDAVEPLLSQFHRIDDEEDDWVSDELPEVMALIGPIAIPALSKYLASPKNPLWARVAVSSSLEKIGVRYPDARQNSIKALIGTLENYQQNDELLNGDIIGSLAGLDAVEAAALVEQAYKADVVDESILGDWEDFQVEVGLLDQRLTEPDEDEEVNTTSFPVGTEPYPQMHQAKKESKKDKNKRKQAKESRKKNRKKKK